ncbi:MAG TPA: hypothetical protein PLY78_01870 [Methanospirillum sp.]|nr:hypothetical protein [Methanospirillum sp.]
MSAPEAYRRLVKEVSFTWTNRLVALRMMEVRGLIRKSLEGQADSENAITLAKVDSAEDETTFDFTAPPFGSTLSGMAELVKQRHDHLRKVEREIDDEVCWLYGITDEDRAAIEAEVGEPPALPTPTPEDLVNHWMGYAIEIIMGRFIP